MPPPNCSFNKYMVGPLMSSAYSVMRDNKIDYLEELLSSVTLLVDVGKIFFLGTQVCLV
jgi:hypothetical protein